MPLPPKDPKAAFEELAKRREAELALQKAKAESNAQVVKERTAAEEQAYAAEEAATRARGEEREEWRQEQHATRLEDEEIRRKKELERIADEERKKKEAEAKAKRDEQMADLHRKAVEKRVKEKIEGAKTEEEKRKKDVTVYEDRQLHELDTETLRRIEHLERDGANRKRALQTQAEHTRSEAEEAYKEAKLHAEHEMTQEMRDAETEEQKRGIRIKESQMINEANEERRRALFNLDETLAQNVFDIDTETKRLIDEVKREADAKKTIAAREADRKRHDAQAQREGVEKWFGRDEPKKDSKDPLS